jgi:hypothetical protein
LFNVSNIMNPIQEKMALLANDLFNKRQRLINVRQANPSMLDERAAQAFETEYRTAELEYAEAKATFARAMKVCRPDA